MRKAVALGNKYTQGIKDVLICLGKSSYSTFNLERIDFSPSRILSALDAISTGDYEAIEEATLHGGIGKLTTREELPIRPYMASLPKYRQWNSMPFSKKCARFIHGSLFFL